MEEIRQQIHNGKQMIVREREVVKTLVGYLQENGWRVSEEITIQGGKVDVAAEKQGKTFLIEAKGEDKGGYTSAEMNFQIGLGQLMSRMKYHEADYGLAIPLTSDFKKVIRKYRGSFAFERLNIYIFTIEENGTCRIILPSNVSKFLEEI